MPYIDFVISKELCQNNKDASMEMVRFSFMSLVFNLNLMTGVLHKSWRHGVYNVPHISDEQTILFKV